MSLPVNLVFTVTDHKQERRYLSFTGDRKLLRFGAEEGVLSATTKFAIEPASNGLIHIRSCYDNHYWVRYSVSEPWLSTSAPEAVEDKSKDNCTLFRPEISSDANFARLKHVRSGLDVVMRPAGDANAYTLCVEQSSPATLFRCIDYASLVKLNKYVVIIGDNYLFLLVRTIGNKPFLRFQSSGPINNDEFGFETFVTRNGNFRIKSMVSGKFWCLEQPSDTTTPSSSWILADYAAESDPTNQNTLFEAKLIIAEPTYAKYSMRCLDNNHFCKRHTSNGIHFNCLAAETKSPEDGTTHIQFSCFGRSRKVTVKNFRHPRVYNTETHELVTNQVLENRNDLPLVAYIRKDGHIHTTKQRFDNGIEHSAYVHTNFVSPIPFLTVDGQVAIPQEAESSEKLWRSTYDFSSPKDVVMSYELPPRTRVTASLIALTATCEVPFSYQVDHQFFGNNSSATQNLDDGVFTGIYTYATPVRIDLVEPLPRPRQEDSDEQVSMDQISPAI